MKFMEHVNRRNNQRILDRPSDGIQEEEMSTKRIIEENFDKRAGINTVVEIEKLSQYRGTWQYAGGHM